MQEKKENILLRGNEILNFLREHRFFDLQESERLELISKFETSRTVFQDYFEPETNKYLLIGIIALAVGIFFWTSAREMDSAYFETGMNMGKYADSTSYEYRSTKEMNSQIMQNYFIGVISFAVAVLMFYLKFFRKKQEFDFELHVREWSPRLDYYQKRPDLLQKTIKQPLAEQAGLEVLKTKGKIETKLENEPLGDFKDKMKLLEELHELKISGALTDEEFNSEKKKILSK
jgi:hypothetical protein